MYADTQPESFWMF